MKVIPFSDEAVAEALEVLRSGGVVAHATETCYGLACDIANLDAVKKVFAIKQRPESQPISGLFKNADHAKQYAEWSDRAEELARQYLPGPLTMILFQHADAPKKLFPIARSLEAQQLETLKATIGVRISSSPIAQMLVEGFGTPISTTSANIHGQPNPYSAEDIQHQFADALVKPDLVIDSGTLPQNPPSTVMDLTADTTIELRVGSILSKEK